MAAAETSENRPEKMARPPGPRRYPLVGNLLQLTGDDMFYVKLNELRKIHGDVIYLELGAMKMLVVFGHEQVQKVLKDEKDRFKYRPSWLVEVQRLQLFKGIVWSNGEETEKLRRFAVPVANPGIGPTTVEQRVQTEATYIVKELQGLKGDSAALKRVFYQAICNINCGIIFGSRYEYSDTEFQEFVAMMDQLLQRGGVKNPLNFFPILQLLPENKKTKCTRQLLSKVCSFVQRKIMAARDTYDRNNPSCLIDLYLAQECDTDSDDYVTEENLSHIIRDFFVAGTENVAIGLLWLVGYMVQYRDVQDKCRQCLQETLPSNDVVTMEDLKSMPYLEAAVQETLRLANIAPLSVPHATQEDVEFNGFGVPGDTMVLTHLQSVHMDPVHWKDPGTFNPDRFLENGKLVTKEAFYPYSIGTRYCLAARLAQMELNIIFSTLLRHFRFSADENGNPPALRPTQPGAFVEPETFHLTWAPV